MFVLEKQLNAAAAAPTTDSGVDKDRHGHLNPKVGGDGRFYTGL